MQSATESNVYNAKDYQLAEISRLLNKIIAEASAQVNPPWKISADSVAEKNHLENHDGQYITIADKTILAMAGPRNAAQLNHILHGLAHGKKPITSIVALVKNETPLKEYFASYFQPEFSIDCNDFEIEKSIFAINVIPAVDATSLVNNNKSSCFYVGIENLNISANYDVQCVCTHLYVKSKLSQKESMIKVYSLPIQTGGGIISASPPGRKEIYQEKSKKYIHFLLEIYKEWQLTGVIAIHCELGSSRTAHLTLVFFLLAQFESLFVPNDSMKTAQNIARIYVEIKKQRPALHPNEAQFSSALLVVGLMKKALCEELNMSKQSINNLGTIPPTQQIVSQSIHGSFWNCPNSELKEVNYTAVELLSDRVALKVLSMEHNKDDEAKSNVSLPCIAQPGNLNK